ncbi:unnamed protein product [Ectocarpus sp. 4 AP-2014]
MLRSLFTDTQPLAWHILMDRVGGKAAPTFRVPASRSRAGLRQHHPLVAGVCAYLRVSLWKFVVCRFAAEVYCKIFERKIVSMLDMTELLYISQVSGLDMVIIGSRRQISPQPYGAAVRQRWGGFSRFDQ